MPNQTIHRKPCVALFMLEPCHVCLTCMLYYVLYLHHENIRTIALVLCMAQTLNFKEPLKKNLCAFDLILSIIFHAFKTFVLRFVT